MRVGVNLEQRRHGQWLAHAIEWPGCTWSAETREQAMAAAPQAVAAFAQWLWERGETDEPPPHIVTQFAQEAAGEWPEADRYLPPTFASDVVPVQAAEIERWVRWLGYTRADLGAVLADAGAEGLQAPAPTDGRERPVADALARLAAAEWSVLVRLQLVAGERPGADFLPEHWEEILTQVRSQVIERVRATSAEERSRWIKSPDGESWTLRKALRLLLEGERAATARVRAALVSAEVLRSQRRTGVYGICTSPLGILVIDKALGPYKGRFDLPGGGVEPGEAPTEALLREFAEETGFQIRLTEYLGAREFHVRWPRPRHTHLHHTARFYRVEVTGGELKSEPDGRDAYGARFVHPDHLTVDACSPLVRTAVAWINAGLWVETPGIYDAWGVKRAAAVER
ncbi:MAG TPA: NUDIX hydrolase [Limnochordia bacterium]|nr:NUDIX hydrolase [Limnochordia bacterium]